MSTWVPAITAGSLDGFLLGVLVTGACFLAIIVSWRVRWRDLAADDAEPPRVEIVALAADPATMVGDPLTLAEEPAAGESGSETYGVAALDHLRALATDSVRYDAAARDHLAAVNSARQWQEAAAARRDQQERMTGVAGWLEERAAAAGAGPARVPWPREPDALGGRSPAPAQAPPDRPAPRGRQGRPGGHRAPHPLGDPTFDAAAGVPKPPGARRPPRHAAPAPSLSGKKKSMSATRSLPDGSRG
jgi:hypothetical protein